MTTAVDPHESLLECGMLVEFDDLRHVVVDGVLYEVLEGVG